jgi:hypothetical protein
LRSQQIPASSSIGEIDDGFLLPACRSEHVDQDFDAELLGNISAAEFRL